MNMSILKTGFAHCILKRWTGPFWLRRQWLEKTQWYSPEQIEQMQLVLLKKLITHCYKTVPYYRRFMIAKGIRPEAIKTLDDIRRFPILTKQDVLEAGESIISTKYPRWMMSMGRTGGTTGTPLVTPRNIFSLGNEHAFVRRQWDWAGMGLSDRTAYLSGRVIADPDRNDEPLWVYDPFMKELILSSYHLCEKTAYQYAEAMRQYKIKAIAGYPAAISFLARVCLNRGVKVKLQAALTTSETVTDEMRAVISEAFDCRVYDFYGAAERVCYIFTCEHGSYHIIPEYGYTELIPVDLSEPNVCSVVATGFWNYGMPLLRYDTGDVVIRSEKKCDCGRSFEAVESISGRKGDVIRTPSGREFGPTLMARVTKGANNILESQVIQDAVDHITILYVPAAIFTDKDLADFKRHMSQYLPDELKIDYRSVERVEKTKSGKMNLVVSKI
jgi:phenylacetate-CoA ligase